MPGTILVSVLEFIGLPLSSSTSIKVSMGKTEYQIGEKGDFYFPLTSLREDFIVELQDDDGNEISRIGFHTKSIVEKGVWEDIFPLGRGHLHLKLQFILNDEERDRIRMMRQSALKKKHDELLNSCLRGAESGSTSVGKAALTFSANDENLQRNTYTLKQFPKLKVLLVSTMTTNLNSADQYKETSSTEPVSQAVDFTQLQHKGLVKKPAIQSPSTKDPQRAIDSEEVAISFTSSEQNDVVMNNLIQSNLEEDSLQYSGKQSPLGRVPSNVRKMISSFERQSGQAQDTKSHIKPPPTIYQSSKFETMASSKTQHSGEEKAGNEEPVGFLQLQGRVKEPVLYIGETREQINSLKHISCKDIGQLKELSTIKILNKQTDSNARNKFKVAHKTDTEEGKYDKDLMRASTFEIDTVSGKMPEKHLDRNHPCNLFGCRQDSKSNPSKEEKRRGNASKGSLHKLNSVVHFDDNDQSFESSGAWIFPDEPRKFCITTGGKNVMSLLESLVTKHISHQRSLDFSILENVEKNAAYIGTGTEVTKHEKIHEIEESKSKNSDENGDEISRGPIKQVIKVGIIIGFGILVLLTRQRKGR